MSWLPHPLPSGVHAVVAARADGSTHAALRKRQWRQLVLPALSKAERRQLVPAYLSMKRCGSAWAKLSSSAEATQAEALAASEVPTAGEPMELIAPNRVIAAVRRTSARAVSGGGGARWAIALVRW